MYRKSMFDRMCPKPLCRNAYDTNAGHDGSWANNAKRSSTPGRLCCTTNASPLAAMIAQFMYGVLRSGLSVRIGKSMGGFRFRVQGSGGKEDVCASFLKDRTLNGRTLNSRFLSPS